MEVYLASPWIPREWVEAHGLTPRGLFSAPDCDAVIPRVFEGVCSFAQRNLEFARAREGSAVVFSSACDQMRRSFDRIQPERAVPAFLFNLPATWQSKVAWRLFRTELERFTCYLERLGGRRPVAQSAFTTICDVVRARSKLLAAWCQPNARAYAEAMAGFHWDGRVTLEPGPDVREVTGVPVAFVGGPLTRAQFGVLDAIESAGGRVALNATETGERSLGWGQLSSAQEADTIDGLARVFFERIVDVWQRPNTRLYAWLRERIVEREVRGIVLWHYIGCDFWRAEAASLREAFGLPVLTLDSDQAHTDHPRLVHRIAAFIEMLL